MPIDGATGKTANRSAARGETRITVEGSWRLIEALNDYAGPRQGNYSWTEPLRTRQRILTPTDIYSPFVSGGIVLCRLHAPFRTAAAFEPLILLPADWAKEAAQAYRESSSDPAWWPSQPGPALFQRSRELVTGPNPILSVMAFRILLENRQVDDTLLLNILPAARDERRSAFLYLLLTSPRPAGDTALKAQIDLILNGGSAWGAAKVFGVLGIYTAMIFRSELSADPTLESIVADLVKTSSKETDPRLRQILDFFARRKEQ